MKRKTYFETDWRKLVNPVFTRYWAAEKKLRQVDPEDQIAWKRAFDEMGTAARQLANEPPTIENPISAKVWTEIIRPLDGEVWPHSGGEPGKGYAVNPEASAFFRDLVFLKLGISYRQLVTRAEQDREAHRKLLQVHRDYYRFRWEGGFKVVRLKFNLEHFKIVVQGLDYGLAELNEIELAYCLDEICPCAKQHSVDYLMKLRTKVKKACHRLIESINEPTSFTI